MYRDTLTEHWKNLYSDFAQEYDRLMQQGEPPACFERWYETRLHRWQSVAYPEGIILEQVEEEAFAKELTDVMKAFRFRPVEQQPLKPTWWSALLGAAAGAVSAGILALLHWEALRIALSGVVVCIVVMLGFLRSQETAKTNEYKRIKEAYVEQLRDYLTELTAVCDRYEAAS